jgi:hypothetical protein
MLKDHCTAAAEPMQGRQDTQHVAAHSAQSIGVSALHPKRAEKDVVAWKDILKFRPYSLVDAL